MQLIVEFGKEICTKYPAMFRDLYLMLPRKLPVLFNFLDMKIFSTKRSDLEPTSNIDVQALTDDELYGRLCEVDWLNYGPDLNHYRWSGQIPVGSSF
jgi:hypothetical protein